MDWQVEDRPLRQVIVSAKMRNNDQGWNPMIKTDSRDAGRRPSPGPPGGRHVSGGIILSNETGAPCTGTRWGRGRPSGGTRLIFLEPEPAWAQPVPLVPFWLSNWEENLGSWTPVLGP